MNALKIAAALSVAVLMPGTVFAQDALRLKDVNVVQQPEPARYQPDSTDYDLADKGKTFDIDCTVGPDGKMRDCEAQPNDMLDQNFVKIGVDNARGFVVDRAARDGSSTAGRTLSLTCQFSRADKAGDEAAADDDRRAQAASQEDRTDVASNDPQR